jgi:diguanylate cyclase (GGDEF)-like protein
MNEMGRPYEVPAEELAHENLELKTQLEKESERRIRAEDEAKLHLLRADNAEREANTDFLTNVLNRRGFAKAMKQISKDGSRMSFLFLDIDNFGQINKKYGTKAGDKALVAVAGFLQDAMRSSDIIARWGGEEFVVGFRRTYAQGVLNKFYDPESGKSKIPEVIVSVENNRGVPVKLNITLSAGVVDYEPGDDFDETIDHADKALRHAKAAGKDQILTTQ